LDEIKSSVEAIAEHFQTPLEAMGVEICFVLDKIEDAVLYSRKYLNIQSDSYKKVWHRIHTVPDATQWPNLLHICQLLFSSTAKVKRTFSVLKAIKTEKRVRYFYIGRTARS